MNILQHSALARSLQAAIKLSVGVKGSPAVNVNPRANEFNPALDGGICAGAYLKITDRTRPTVAADLRG